VEDKTI
jgi:hypothetical protein